MIRSAATRLLPVLLLAAALLAWPSAHAVQPDEILDDPALESRARDLSAGLRCLVCQNQSIDDSNAGLARDLRLIVRQRLLAGDDDAAVLRYVTDRYGDYVLLKPPVDSRTWLLWGAPAILVALGLLIMWTWLRPAATGTEAAPQPLSAEERRRARRLLPGKGGADRTSPPHIAGGKENNP